MAISDIPVRENNDRIDASWFNTIRSELLTSGSTNSVLELVASDSISSATTHVMADSSSATVDITLYTPSSFGKEITIKCIDVTNGCSVIPSFGLTIEGESTYNFRYDNESITLIYTDSYDWRII